VSDGRRFAVLLFMLAGNLGWAGSFGEFGDFIFYIFGVVWLV
jgi:hypothetical protein